MPNFSCMETVNHYFSNDISFVNFASIAPSINKWQGKKKFTLTETIHLLLRTILPAEIKYVLAKLLKPTHSFLLCSKNLNTTREICIM